MARNAGASSRRTDEELALIIDETSQWSLLDLNGTVLETAVSLRHALQKAGQLSIINKLSGVARRPTYDIILLRPQIKRLVTSFVK